MERSHDDRPVGQASESVGGSRKHILISSSVGEGDGSIVEMFFNRRFSRLAARPSYGVRVGESPHCESCTRPEDAVPGTAGSVESG